MDSVSSRNDLDCCAGYCDVCRFVCDSFHNFEDEQALREDERDCNRFTSYLRRTWREHLSGSCRSVRAKR